MRSPVLTPCQRASVRGGDVEPLAELGLEGGLVEDAPPAGEFLRRRILHERLRGALEVGDEVRGPVLARDAREDRILDERIDPLRADPAGLGRGDLVRVGGGEAVKGFWVSG